MFFSYVFILIALRSLQYSQSLQTGYTCETSVTLTCPVAKKLIILDVTYSLECSNSNEEKTDSRIYAPSHCIGYDRDRASTLCNGQRTCTIDNNLEQRPSFLIGKQATCEFTGQSINVDYSCVPDFYSSELPRIDICSLQSLHSITEGFIHTSNYPNGYPNSRLCSKTVPSPDAGHRLKIYALNFDLEGLSVLRLLGIKRVNDWLQINNSGKKMFGTLSPYTLLFDDVIEASLLFKSDFANTKRSYTGFLLYFIVTPIRTSRSSTTTSVTTTRGKTLSINSTILAILSNNNYDRSTTVLIESKSSALVSDNRNQNNIGLTLLVVFLSGTLFVVICASILYKRRNDRRVRYLTDMFNSFFSSRQKDITLNAIDNNDETTLNNTVQSKLDLSLMYQNEEFTKMNDYNDKCHQAPILNCVNVNEKCENQVKQIFIENLKTCPSPYLSYRYAENKFSAKEQINNEEASKNSNLYSQDPLATINSSQNFDNNSLLYEYVDLNHQQQQSTEESRKEQEKVIYDTINPNNEQFAHHEMDYDTVIYATPRDA